MMIYSSIPHQAIHEYRETERRKWTEKNTAIIQRVRDIAFPPGTPQLAFVHVLDLKKEGLIKPHVDAVKVSEKKFFSRTLLNKGMKHSGNCKSFSLLAVGLTLSPLAVNFEDR